MPPSSHPLLHRFAQEKLIAVVRTHSAESALWASQVLIEAGIRLIEITYTVPDASQVIETLCERFPEAVIGAGTILEARDALQALAAGAQFLVSPVLLEPLIQFGQEQGIFTLPGCMTPTEIHHAWQLGAPAVKVFPADATGGPAFISAVRGPMPEIPLIPTGGVQLEDLAGYLKAGALAVGIGSPLLPKAWIQSRDATRITELAQQYLDVRDTYLATC